MNIPTNKNEISNTKKTTIIANDIGKLNIPNRGYTQRPFSQNVSKNLKSNKMLFVYRLISIKLLKKILTQLHITMQIPNILRMKP